MTEETTTPLSVLAIEALLYLAFGIAGFVILVLIVAKYGVAI